MPRYMKKIPLYLQIFAGMGAGLVFGILLPNQVAWIAPLGTIFLKLLKMIVIPLIFVSIVDGITRMGNIQKLSSLGWKTIVYYLGTNVLAVFVSLILVNMIQPGEGVKAFGTSAADYATKGFSLEIIPSNIVASFAQGNSIQIIFVAILLGIALVVMFQKVPHIISLISEAHDILLSITGFLVRLAPIGVFGLMASMVSALDWQVFVGIGKFAITILLGLIIHGCLILPLLFRMFSKRPLGDFFQKMRPALLSAFSTSSSSATLPITLNCVEKEVGVRKEIPGFVLPIGATVNMDGTAMYEATACLFIAQAVGIELSLMQQLIVFFTASLAAVGAAAIPSAGLVTLTLVLSAVGLPLEGIGLLLAIDRPLDMSRTTVNVWGDMVGCAVIEGISTSEPNKTD